MISIRMTSEAYKNLFVMIERFDNTLVFDWPQSKFVAIKDLQSRYQSMVLDTTMPGRYAVTFSNTIKEQFPIGTPLCFWFYISTGDLSPSKRAIWMEAVVIDKLPFLFCNSLTAIYITEVA